MTTPAANAQVLPGGQGQGSEPAGNNQSNTQRQLASTPGQESGLGRDLPVFDPGTEVITWDGRHWSVTDNRVFQARFEKYLAAPAAVSEEDQAYRDLIDEILQLLSPNRPQEPNLSAAVALLPEAAQYPIDARLSDSLANAIWGVWMSHKNQRALRDANREMIQRRKQLEWNTEVAADAPATSGTGRDTDQSENGASAEQTTRDLGRMAGYIRDIAELEARMKVNEAQIAADRLQSKIEFQALMVQMFLQRRFEHVVMATRFYRNLFKDGDSKLQIEEGSDVATMFSSGLGFSPTVGTLDAFANEAIRDVDEAVQSFEHLLSRGDVQSASKRLSEAFVMGEYLPRVRRLELEKKAKIMEFVRDSHQLVSAIEVKDYALAEELIERMNSVARDFDASKPRATIETARAVSRMHLLRARNAAMQGDEQVVARELRSATEIWPTNPELSDLSEMIGEASDIQSQALQDFDRLYSQRDFRQIFNDQGRYAGAVVGDPERQQQLREAIESVTKINMAVSGARQTAENGNIWGAWELAEQTHREFPQDPEISKLRSDLSVRAAEFVAALERAKEFEKRGQAGSSLSWYLRAKQTYPGSSFASEGINRLVEDLRGDLAESDQAPEPDETGQAETALR